VREKQLEYTWRRSLMQRYRDFGVCTRQALDYADELLQTELDESAKNSLMQAYRVLPAYEDVPASLELLKNKGHRLYPFSNGTVDMVTAVLENAGIEHFFENVISVDSLQTFKPDPGVYHHVIQVTNVTAENCWLVSSNGFDVIGAVSAGMKAAWLKRFDGVVLDPWEFEPTQVIRSLGELPQVV
jgi:2-haloacid dehalogenase